MSAQNEKATLEDRREYIKSQIAENDDKIRQYEQGEEQLLKDISIEAMKLVSIAKDIDWEMAWKSRRSALEAKIRDIQNVIEIDEKKASLDDELWAKKMKERGLDDASKESKLQMKRREIESIETELAAGEERIIGAKQKIQSQQEIVDLNDPKISSAKARLNKVRHEIEQIKGSNIFEDPHFHIDQTRDPRDHTFLQVCSQNDDYDTAKLCLELGANPNVMNGDRLMAIGKKEVAIQSMIVILFSLTSYLIHDDQLSL